MSAADLLDRHLSQDLDGYDDYQYRMGILAAVQYRWSRRWGVAFIWNTGGTTAKTTAFSHGKYKKRTASFQSFSLVFERRFSSGPTATCTTDSDLALCSVKLKKYPPLPRGRSSNHPLGHNPASQTHWRVL